MVANTVGILKMFECEYNALVDRKEKELEQELEDARNVLNSRAEKSGAKLVECRICFNNFEESWAVNKCQPVEHLYCLACLQKLLFTSNSDNCVRYKCPTCRKQCLYSEMPFEYEYSMRLQNTDLIHQLREKLLTQKKFSIN